MKESHEKQPQKKTGDDARVDPKDRARNNEDASDELSIEELEEAAGGSGTYTSPEPNAAC
jgi:hypothetical protein